MTRQGFTLHEMLISLGVMSGVMLLAAHLATGQLRFVRGAAERTARVTQVGHASAIPAGALWGASPAQDDITVALDTAIEMLVPIGATFACASAEGEVVIPAARPATGNALASFAEQPDAGDRVMVLFEDSLGATWLTLHIAETLPPQTACTLFTDFSETRRLALVERLVVPPGAALRFARPIRYSHYRGSDGRWYLGARDWNREFQRFNTIQPIAGPLDPYSPDPLKTGLRFVYRDDHGRDLPSPVERTRIASVTIISRATAPPYADSAAVTVGLRNVR